MDDKVVTLKEAYEAAQEAADRAEAALDQRKALVWSIYDKEYKEAYGG